MVYACEAAMCWADDRKLKKLEKYPMMRGVTWVKFPKDGSRRATWKRLLRRKDKFEITKSSRLCSRHFDAEQIFPDGHASGYPHYFFWNDYGQRKPVRKSDAIEKRERAANASSPLTAPVDTSRWGSQTWSGGDPTFCERAEVLCDQEVTVEASTHSRRKNPFGPMSSMPAEVPQPTDHDYINSACTSSSTQSTQTEITATDFLKLETCLKRLSATQTQLITVDVRELEACLKLLSAETPGEATQAEVPSCSADLGAAMKCLFDQDSFEDWDDDSDMESTSMWQDDTEELEEPPAENHIPPSPVSEFVERDQPRECFICNGRKYMRVRHTGARRKEPLLTCTKPGTVMKLQDAAMKTGNDALLREIQDNDLIASKSGYHRTCYQKSTEVLYRKPRDEKKLDELYYRPSYKVFCSDVIEKKIIEKNEVIALTKLRDMFVELIRKEQGLDASSYTTHRLKMKLQKSYHQLQFVQQPCRNKSQLVMVTQEQDKKDSLESSLSV